jgi:hypothetical protein
MKDFCARAIFAGAERKVGDPLQGSTHMSRALLELQAVS